MYLRIDIHIFNNVFFFIKCIKSVFVIQSQYIKSMHAYVFYNIQIQLIILNTLIIIYTYIIKNFYFFFFGEGGYNYSQ